MGTFADEQVLYNNNPSPTTAVGLAQMRYNQTAIRELPGASAPVIVEITDGAIAPTSAFVRVDTEGQAGGDDLEVISPVLSDTDSLHDGMILYLQAADQDRVVTVRNTASANGIQTFDGQDVVLDATTWLVLQLRQGTWLEVHRLREAAARAAHAAMPSAYVVILSPNFDTNGIAVFQVDADGYVWSFCTVAGANQYINIASAASISDFSDKSKLKTVSILPPWTGSNSARAVWIAVSAGDYVQLVNNGQGRETHFCYCNGSVPTN